MSKDPIKYKNVKVGDLLRSESFQGGYATVLDKRMEWELTPTSNDHVEWGLIRVVDSYGDVYWFELEEYDVYFVSYPPTPLPRDEFATVLSESVYVGKDNK
tara:strand:+ start:333 stop:635 length:303 start_codon:yes stop_codon:yes gene_type:complete